MPHLLANGIQTHYKTTAADVDQPQDAPTVVFVHGIGTDSLASFYLTLSAPLASAGINVVGYDLRGHGRSDRPASGYTLDDFVDDLTGVLAELRVSGPIHLVGNSFGGTVAFAYAARHPDRVASIISIEAEPPTDVWSYKMTALMRFSMEILDREDTYAWIAANQGTHHARLMRQAHERLTSTAMPDEIPSGTMMGPDDLARITCPVLSVIGAQGFQAEDPQVLERMLPNCRSVVIGGQDHSVLVEAHRVVRQLVLDWVADQHPAPIGRAGRE